MTKLVQNTIRPDAFTLSWVLPFTGYAVTLKIVPDADTATPVTLSGAIDPSDLNKYHIATTNPSDIAQSGNYRCQAILVGGGEIIYDEIFNVNVGAVL